LLTREDGGGRDRQGRREGEASGQPMTNEWRSEHAALLFLVDVRRVENG
jgi:hypothetical protein